MKRKKLPAMTYPISIELQYSRVLKGLVKEMKFHTRAILYPALPDMVESAVPFDPAIHVDADDWNYQLNNAIEKILNKMEKPTKAAIQELDNIAKDTDAFNQRRWNSLIRKAYGVSPTNVDPARYNDLMKLWAQENAKLITNIPQKAMLQIRDETIDALQSGRTVDDLKATIMERIDVSDSRAELISRDQVAKLNADLTKSRQEDAGVESYIWRTVGDERVRDSHDQCDGQTYTWDTPPIDPGCHPGEDFQCRCWAEPILPSRMSFEMDLEEAA